METSTISEARFIARNISFGYRCRKGRPVTFRAQAAVRRWFRSVQHRRCGLSLRLDPSAGRPRTDRLASGRGIWGGYAMIDRIAQMQPNNLTRFIEVYMVAAARAEYKNRTAHMSVTPVDLISWQSGAPLRGRSQINARGFLPVKNHAIAILPLVDLSKLLRHPEKT